ncbi:peptidase [Salmonella enterica]|uniref:peptidase n=1 Tax=Salmonella enterica TaxID=28901 RepID=UPI0020161CC9|nr:peptidase [Salmonella enterica]
MINIPELVFDDEPPSTDVTGAGGFDELVQPASHSETSDSAAMRLTVNFGLPALIYPPGKIWLTTSDVRTVQRIR